LGKGLTQTDRGEPDPEAGETLKEANRRVGLALSAHTVDSFWDGETMDLHMAVDGVLDCEDDPIDKQ
jgi:hypothetical protein